MGYCQTNSHVSDHERTHSCINWISRRKQLPAPDSALAKGYEPAGHSDDVIEWLQQRVAYLERELAGAEDRYTQLNGIYQKLADQWNAYQATAKPDNRNVHRAEAAGELARKLAEALIGLAYDKDARRALTDVLDALRQEQESQTWEKYLPEPR